MPPLRIGAHVSRSGGYQQAADHTAQMGGRCFQVFTGAPQRLLFPVDALAKKPEKARAQIEAELRALRDRAALPVGHADHLTPFIHSPYTINLCDAAKQALNAKVLVQELEMADKMGAVGVVVHTGTQRAKQAGQTRWGAYETYVATVKRVLATFTGKARVLLETSAGQGQSIGVTMRDFGRLYNAFTEAEQRDRLGIVIDTCHVYVAGYDVATAKGVDAFVHELFRYVRRSDVKLIHLNDSAKSLGSQVDRHAPLGKGYVYKASYKGLEALLGYFPDACYVLETHDQPPYAQYAHEIAKVRSLTPRAPQALAPGPKVDGHAAVLGRMRAAFEAMASLYYAQQDGIRGDAYSEAVYRVEMLTPATLPTTKAACMALPGIGDKLSDKMLELYYTDRLTKLEALQADPVTNATIELLTVPGVGVKTVKGYVEQGIRSIEALREAVQRGAVQLTAAQALGLAHVDDLRQRVPRAEAEGLDAHLQTLATDRAARIELVGSYRRGKPTLGDIDVLATGVPMADLLAHVEARYDVRGYVAKGPRKAALLVVLDTVVRHVDVLVTDAATYPYALVHFTGSKFFNIKLRTVAKQQGYSLSEHGLKPVGKPAGRPVKKGTVREEADVFRVLGVAFVAAGGR